MMFPGLRGGIGNPGRLERFYGEVDDILAATDFLASQPYVDPSRIYLGGHSTSGTLVLLTAEVSSRFRAVFAFGPIANPMAFIPGFVPVDPRGADPRETTLRSPLLWLSEIQSDTFVVEGDEYEYANEDDFHLLRAVSTNPKVRFLPARGATHSSYLASVNELVAQCILRDGRESDGIRLDSQAFDAAVASDWWMK